MPRRTPIGLLAALPHCKQKARRVGRRAFHRFRGGVTRSAMPHRYREPVENRLPLQPLRMSGHPLPVSLPDRSVGVLLSVIRLTYAQADRAKRLLIRNQAQSSEMAAIAIFVSRVTRRNVDVEALKTVIIFCAAGSTVSLMFACYGLDLSPGFF
jgi:hypothetical protein